MLMLVLDLPWLSLVGLLPWAGYQFVHYNGNYSHSIGEKITLLLIFIEWELILLRYD